MSDKKIFGSAGSSFPEEIFFDNNKKSYSDKENSSSQVNQQNIGNILSNETNNNVSQEENNSNNKQGNTFGNSPLSSMLPLLSNLMPKGATANPLLTSILSGQQTNPTELISSILSQKSNTAKKEVVQATPLPVEKLNIESAKSVLDYYNHK